MPFEQKGPEPLRDILGRLFITRGWGRQQERLQLERAWAAAAGAETAKQTRVGGLRRGVLEVLVGNAILLQELAHFQKRRLLEEMRRQLPGRAVLDLRFRAGVVNEE
jgi:predicted nucleic acid-binding Zn ribbon protein